MLSVDDYNIRPAKLASIFRIPHRTPLILPDIPEKYSGYAAGRRQDSRVRSGSGRSSGGSVSSPHHALPERSCSPSVSSTALRRLSWSRHSGPYLHQAAQPRSFLGFTLYFPHRRHLRRRSSLKNSKGSPQCTQGAGKMSLCFQYRVSCPGHLFFAMAGLHYDLIPYCTPLHELNRRAWTIEAARWFSPGCA